MLITAPKRSLSPASCLESLVAPQASSLHNQPFFESSIADPHGARRWYAVHVGLGPSPPFTANFASLDLARGEGS